MKFNLAAIILATIFYLSMFISSNLGDGFGGEGPFNIASVTYGLLFSGLSSFILSKIAWWGLIPSLLGYTIASGIILFFKYKEHVTV
jgi:hypothetical protein